MLRKIPRFNILQYLLGESRTDMMVEEQDRKDAVLVAMSDHYMRRILAATMVEGKSIDEISKEKMIPVSTCYRRLFQECPGWWTIFDF